MDVTINSLDNDEWKSLTKDDIVTLSKLEDNLQIFAFYMPISEMSLCLL